MPANPSAPAAPAALPELIDSHSHFDAAEFDADRDAAYARARAAGVVQQVVPGVRADTWDGLDAVVARYPGLYGAWGLHPCYLAVHRPQHLAELRARIASRRPVAIGECGLDAFIAQPDLPAQETCFLEQLRIARDTGLPVIVHARRAVDAVLKCIRRIGGRDGLSGVVHSFAGSLEQAERLRAHGFLISLGGPLTYDRARRLQRLVQALPADGLLLETDAPDQPGVAHRHARNEPAYLPEVLAAVAALRDESPAAVAAASTAAARRLFGLPSSVDGVQPPAARA